MIYNSTLPHALAIGMTKKEFMKSKPFELKSHQIAYELKEKKKDEENWLLGLYVKSAFETVISHAINGFSKKKSDAKYIEMPFLFMEDKNKQLTQEEIDDMEIQKMIFAEEQWIKASQRKGLPETIIK